MTVRQLRVVAAGGVALAALAAVVVLLLFVAPGWWRGEGGSYAPNALETSTRIDPPSALFGDVLTARAAVLVDRRRLDPGSVQLYARFAPYRVVSSVRRVTGDVGHATRVEFVFRIQCVTVACLDVMEREREDGRRVTTPVAFRAAELTAEDPAGRATTAQVRWPRVVVRSRLSSEEVASGEPRAAAFAAPDVSYGASPDRLGWSLVALATLLTLCGGYLVATAVRGRPLVRALRIPAHLTAVDRALVLARHAAATGDTAGERRALERLGAELRKSGKADLAVAARRLAWSESRPSENDLDELAHELARMGNGR